MGSLWVMCMVHARALRLGFFEGMQVAVVVLSYCEHSVMLSQVTFLRGRGDEHAGMAKQRNARVETERTCPKWSEEAASSHMFVIKLFGYANRSHKARCRCDRQNLLFHPHSLTKCPVPLFAIVLCIQCIRCHLRQLHGLQNASMYQQGVPSLP